MAGCCCSDDFVWIVAVLLVCCPMEVYREVFEGAMVCLICPLQLLRLSHYGKLGWKRISLTTYTLSNLLAAVAVPLVFPLVEPHADFFFFFFLDCIPENSE